MNNKYIHWNKVVNDSCSEKGQNSLDNLFITNNLTSSKNICGVFPYRGKNVSHQSELVKRQKKSKDWLVTLQSSPNKDSMWLHYPRSRASTRLCLTIWYFPSEAWERETTGLVYRGSLPAPVLAGGAWGWGEQALQSPRHSDKLQRHKSLVWGARQHLTLSSCTTQTSKKSLLGPRLQNLFSKSWAIGGFWTFA